MASPHLYVRSTDGSDADNGTTWALAKASVAGAAAIDSTTDKRIWVSNNHAESNAAAQTWAFAGTAADPTWLVAVSDSGSPEPPTAISTAACTTTGANDFTITGNVYIRGVQINCGTGAVNAAIRMSGDTTHQTYEACDILVHATGSAAIIAIGTAGNNQPMAVYWRDVTVELNNAASSITLSMGSLQWDGGAYVAGVALTGGLIKPNSAGEHLVVRISGVDLTDVGVTGYLVSKVASARCDVQFRNCKVPAWTTGGLYSGTLQAGDRIEMYNCDSADTNYRLWIADQWGEIRSSTSVYNDAGADDGSATGFSWEMVSSANAEFPHQVLLSPEIVKWNDTTTGTLTATVEIVHNSQGSGSGGALQDNEIWLEVMCMDPGGAPIGKWQSDRCDNLNLNANAADQTSSSATWTGDAAGWDTQKLVVSFTPKEKGYVHARVCLAKASSTVYVDPLLTVS